MKQIKENKVLNKFYLMRSYFDIGMNVISYVTGKFPMIAGLIIILQFLEIPIDKNYLWTYVIVALVGCTVLGFIYQKTGLFYLERQKSTLLDPV